MFGGAGGPEGYNVICSQRDWSRRRVRGKPLRHGWYTVRAASGRRSGCVELDYSASPRNAKLNPERLLRHFVVQPDPANPDLLLGKAYVKVGALVPVAFFVLERDRRIA
jgi:hypothetical protein